MDVDKDEGIAIGDDTDIALESWSLTRYDRYDSSNSGEAGDRLETEGYPPMVRFTSKGEGMSGDDGDWIGWAVMSLMGATE